MLCFYMGSRVRVLRITTVIPAKAGIQRGRARGGARDLTVNPSYVRLCTAPEGDPWTTTVIPAKAGIQRGRARGRRT